MAELPVLTIDLGGTKIHTALISEDGRMIAEDYRLSMADEGPEAVIQRIFAGIEKLLDEESMSISMIHSIGIASASIIDIDKGLITFSPNLPGLNDIFLRDILHDKYGIDTYLINDSSAAALGEHRYGAGKGVRNLIYLAVSTGIGGGIIIEDKLYLGASGCAGELGHMTIKADGPLCQCGNTGCLEVLASGTAMAREAKERIRAGENTILVEMAKGVIEDITAETISMAARNGDSLAQEVISEAAVYLGVGLANIVNSFNPEMIIIGGGVSKIGDLLFNPAIQEMRRRAFKLPAQAVRILPAELGGNAEVIGAAIFAREQKSG